jgi:hypothetical protein
MTQDEIIRMAREAGILNSEVDNQVVEIEDLERFANLVAEAAKAQPQDEPVAWMRDNEDCTDCFVWERDEEHTIPLYTTPPVVPQGEPVASLDSDGFPWSKEGVECRTTPDTYKPLYTTPPSVEAIAEWYLIAQQYKTECEQAVEAAIEATKEKAAKVCEELGWRDSSEFAAAIRGMK